LSIAWKVSGGSVRSSAWPIYNPSMIAGFGGNVQSAALSHQNSGS
jgi:hypothetical protein